MGANAAATSLPRHPRLRRVESFPISQSGGEVVFVLRDPEGFSGPVVLPHAAAVLASLMNGNRTLEELQEDLSRQFGSSVELADVEQVVRDLDERYFLDTDRFRSRWKAEIETYLNRPSRPAAHAGGAYAAEPSALREQLAALFAAQGDPPPSSSTPTGRLCGVLSPHIDLRRGGPAFAAAYRAIADQTDADLFIIFGTAHNPMRNLYSLTRKGFETPLGTVATDREFVARLAAKMKTAGGDEELNLFADELAHRHEHSIEFQVLFLQYLLGERRPFKIVPILTGSFHEFFGQGGSPAAAPRVSAFVAAVRDAITAHPGRVCTIASGDLAHIGQRYGDRAFLNVDRLKEQGESDRQLLDAICKPDADALFGLIARAGDPHRVCGLSPLYTMLEVTRPARGQLLRYDQAVELDGTSCVSFASAAFYQD